MATVQEKLQEALDELATLKQTAVDEKQERVEAVNLLKDEIKRLEDLIAAGGDTETLAKLQEVVDGIKEASDLVEGISEDDVV